MAGWDSEGFWKLVQKFIYKSPPQSLQNPETGNLNPEQGTLKEFSGLGVEASLKEV